MTRLEEMIMEEGEKKGFQKGREEGMKRGREEGIKRGREEGMKKGREEGLQRGMKTGRSYQTGIYIYWLGSGSTRNDASIECAVEGSVDREYHSTLSGDLLAGKCRQ